MRRRGNTKQCLRKTEKVKRERGGHTYTSFIYRRSTETGRGRCSGVSGVAGLPQKLLQTGVTEAMSTGGHLDGLPHRLAAERTLEPSLWLLQELVIKPGHRYRFQEGKGGYFSCCCFLFSFFGLRAAG